MRCRDGRIVELGLDLRPAVGEGTAEKVLDASGQLVFPGGVDPHVHLALPVAGTVSADDFASGTTAALAGGTTTVIDFVHPERGQDPMRALADRRREAAGAVIDYGFHMAITWWGETTPDAMARCVHDEGIASFKVYMAYLDSVGIDDRDLVRVMECSAELGALLVVHAEHGVVIEHLREKLARQQGPLADPALHPRSRPPATEGEATERALMLARLTGAPLYVFHMTCEESVTALATARTRGQVAFGETCPHYLLFDDSVYHRPGFEGAAFVVAPPIRPAGHQDVLWRALTNDTLQVVSTDHCPFTWAQKELGRRDFRQIPGGAAGIEHRLALLYHFGVGQGRIDLHRFVDLVSTRPAKLFGLFPRKGSLAPGSDADLVLWDPDATQTLSAATHHHRCDTSLYEGLELRGAPTTVVTGGRISFHDGEPRTKPGDGRFVARTAYAR